MKEKKELILDQVESGWDYIHNYLDSEAQMLTNDPEWDFNSPWSEDLFDYLVDNNQYYLFKLFQDIFFDFPTNLVDDEDEEMFIECHNIIKHLLWYELSLNSNK